MQNYNLLNINQLAINISLGWPDEERARRQEILVDISIHCPTTPKACESDHLDDTYCYRHLIENLRAHLASKPFKLIEHVTREIYLFVKSLLPADYEVHVSLTKKPMIIGLGSVTFHHGDKP